MPALIYGIISYVVFLGAAAYAIGFIGGFGVPKTIDSSAPCGLAEALTIDVGLLLLFAVQHSVMARPTFKRWWTRFVPAAVERSTYVLLTSLIFGLLFWQWRPLPRIVWHLDGVARLILLALYAIGWAVIVLSTFMVSHLDFFGLKQAHSAMAGRAYEPPAFQTRWLYQLVRHPIMVGFLIAFWAAPTMTVGHLLFAATATGYIFVGVWLEERDLSASLGDDYRRYQRRVRAFLPIPKRKADMR